MPLKFLLKKRMNKSIKITLVPIAFEKKTQSSLKVSTRIQVILFLTKF